MLTAFAQTEAPPAAGSAPPAPPPPPAPPQFAEQLRALSDNVAGNWEAWLVAVGLMAAAVVAAIIIHLVVFKLLDRAARRTPWTIDEILVARLRRPGRFILPILAVHLTLGTLEAAAGEPLGLVRHTLSILLIAAATWLLIALAFAGEDFIRSRHDVTVADNLDARKIHTQLRVVRRTLTIFIFVVGAAAILMTFPGVSQFGASLLASAGLAGLIVGLAARPGVENIIAGLQIALTQPIRLDDVVVIDGNFGRIEEITATYVVLKVWDERRLVVPFSRIIAQPIENWTYTSADTLGTVYLYCDYSVDVQKVRAELDRIVKGPPSPDSPGESAPAAGPHPKWDGRVCGLVVTDATDKTLQLRALVSAADSGKSFDLRCEIREKLIAFLQREYPGSLPKVRAEISDLAPPQGAAASPATQDANP